MGYQFRRDLRNVAIVAHVDHGKTTLVDAMLRQAGAFGAHQHVAERVMDSGDLEREKGITILAKNTGISYTGPAAQAVAGVPRVTINVIDTPGHADFGGEVERGLSMVDGVVLLVDASEGPLPQTRFVLRKALAARLPIIIVVNKVDRSDARISEVVEETTDLLLALAADLTDSHLTDPVSAAQTAHSGQGGGGGQGAPAGGGAGVTTGAGASTGTDSYLELVLEAPIVFAAAKVGAASLNQPDDGALPDNPDLEPLFATILAHVPPPSFDPALPLRAQVTNLDASPYLGRLALLRVYSGEIRKGEQVAWVTAPAPGSPQIAAKRDLGGKKGEQVAWVAAPPAGQPDGDAAPAEPMVRPAKIVELLETRGLDRVPVASARAGDIVAIAGIPDIMIGDTLADLAHPAALPPIVVDEPAISVTIGINTSPLAGKGVGGKPAKGHKVTARQVQDRLNQELVGNVSLRVVPTGRPDAWEVQGRGELALAILVEQMRREGFELTVGKPQVVTRVIDGRLHEPMERLTIDVPEQYLGTVTQLLASRKGRLATMANHGTGWVRMEFVVPARGLIGFRTRFLTETRGTGIAASISEGYQPWLGEIESRNTGSLVADRAGAATPYAMINLQERGSFFVEPAAEVYEGMVVGENSRNEDMDVNVTREKKLTNVRSSTADAFENLVPPRRLTLEESLEFAADDECVEVTPQIVRIRKVALSQVDRSRAASRAKAAAKADA